jgi:hypothetical protein
MSPLDLIRGDDGKMVLTKLQAATFHALLAATVLTVTGVRVYRYVKSGEPPTGGEWLFDATMWGLYAAVAVGHAVIDKTGAQVAAFKNKQLESEQPPGTVVTSSTTSVTKETLP